MARRKKFDYFEAFEKQSEIACEAADMLMATVEGYGSTEELHDILERAHVIEQAGDEANHAILDSVAVDFMTPIDREDVIDMAMRLDSVTDYIEGVIQCFYMYDVHTMHEAAHEMADLIRKSTQALHRAMGGFREFKKAQSFRELLEQVNVYEEEADALYLETVRALYVSGRDDPMHVEVWSRIFDRMERSCDACEHVADTMGSIMLKNM